MRTTATLLLTGTLALAGCSKKAPTLPTQAIDRAAACSAIQVASEQEAAGLKGHLSAEAQERVLHYALLAGSGDGTYRADTADAVIRRTAPIFAATVKGRWQTLKPACAEAFPATAIAAPPLPAKPFERDVQCYALNAFMRKALGQYEGRYSADTAKMDMLADKLDRRMTPDVQRLGRKGDALQARKADALAAAAALGPPPAVLKACSGSVG